MKKRFFLLLALTAALLALGMSTAMATEEECQHFFSYCDSPDVCADCGGPYRGQSILHHWSPYQSDETYHWWVCEVCGEKSARSYHMAYCDAPDVCVQCGYQGDIWDVEHERDWEWHHNETEHWLVCPRCQTELDRSSHRSRCTESVCSSCGEPLSGITAEVDHRIDETWYSDATHHWRKCPDCGEIQDYTEHYAPCLHPGVCRTCGKPCDKVVHSFYGDYQYDDESHWQTCWDCGEVKKESHNLIVEDTYTYCTGCPYRKYIEHEHWARCYRPNVCAICYEPYSGDDIRHDPDAIEYWVNGNYHAWQCADCGYGVYDEEHTLEYAHDDTYHWYFCTKCGEVLGGKYEHYYAYCDNPSVCAVCGGPYSGDDIEHDWSDDWQHNDTEHWQVCTRCGEERYRDIHLATCDNPGVCAYCGIPCDEVAHVSGGYQYNDTEHWEYCSRCGKEWVRSEHGAWCDEPGVCAWCGASYSGDNIVHDWGEIQYDETEHWVYCTLCGEEILRYEHEAMCDNPGVCYYCGQPYSGSNVRHEWSDWQYSDTEHWQVCTQCGEEQSRSEHAAWCDQPGVCLWCGASYSGSNIEHDWSDYWKSDGTFHWIGCTLCDAVLYKEVHYVDCENQNNQCAACGIACENPIISHTWNGYTHDDLYHWHECLYCGTAISREAHYAYCDNPGVCAVCGYEKAGIPIYHDQDTSNFTIDKNYHTSECRRCGLKYIEQHYVSCTNPGICAVCGTAVSGVTVQHTYFNYEFDADYHWYTCAHCGLEIKKEHARNCIGDNTCYFCGQPYSGSNVTHYYDETVGYQYLHDETNHWNVCTECGEKYDVEAHTFGDDGVCTVCDYSKPAVTDAPTAAPTEKPTEKPTEQPTEEPTVTPTAKPTAAPTEKPTEQPTTEPTAAPTDTPHEHAWTVTAKTPATCEKEGVTAYSCACGETKFETVKALGHNFAEFVSQGDGTHRSDCTRCGTFTVKPCQMQSRTVLGIACEVCGVCGYVHIPELDGIALPEAPVADATAVTTTGEAASILVFDVTASLPEDSTFVLCLRVMPSEGAALPGSVRITVPCTLDTTGLRLVFIPEGGLPVEIPFEVIDGMLTFTADAPGVFALVPIQE